MPDHFAALHAEPLLAVSGSAAADILTRCFEGYVIPARFTPEGFVRRNASEHVDAEASLVWRRGDEPVGMILVARRGWSSRVAAMAVMPAARGQGVGRHMIEAALASARVRGDRRMLLEVIEQNPPAVALYRAVGFRERRRLVGYNHAALAAGDATLAEVDLAEAARFMSRAADADLPWMLAPETLAGLSAPVQAFALNDAAMAIVANLPDALILRALAVLPDQRRRGLGSRLLRGLARQFPGKPVKLVAIVPEDLAPGFFTHHGFTLDALSQFEMEVQFA